MCYVRNPTAALLFVVRLDEIDIRLLYLAEAFGHVFEKCRIPWLGIEMLSQVFGTERVAVASHDLVTHQPQLFAVHAGEVFLGEETVGGLRIVAGGSCVFVGWIRLLVRLAELVVAVFDPACHLLGDPYIVAAEVGVGAVPLAVDFLKGIVIMGIVQLFINTGIKDVLDFVVAPPCEISGSPRSHKVTIVVSPVAFCEVVGMVSVGAFELGIAQFSERELDVLHLEVDVFRETVQENHEIDVACDGCHGVRFEVVEDEV